MNGKSEVKPVIFYLTAGALMVYIAIEVSLILITSWMPPTCIGGGCLLEKSVINMVSVLKYALLFTVAYGFTLCYFASRRRG
jgi:hypothetical protein